MGPLAISAGKFSNEHLQAAIDEAMTRLPADKNVAIVAHQVYHQDGTAVENVTAVSVVARGPGGFTVEAAAYRDWVHKDIGAEVEFVKTF